MSSTVQYTRTLATAAGSFTHICQIAGSDATPFGVQLSVAESAAPAVRRVYRLRASPNATGNGVWRRLVPEANPEDGAAWAVELSSGGNTTQLRVVRTATSEATTALTCKVTAAAAPGRGVTFSEPETLTGTGAAAEQEVLESAFIAQVDGKVGINTPTPAATLDVRGSAAVSGNVQFPGISDNATGTGLYWNSTTGQVHRGPGFQGTASALQMPYNVTMSGNVNMTALPSATASNIVFVDPSNGRLSRGTASSFGASSFQNSQSSGYIIFTNGLRIMWGITYNSLTNNYQTVWYPTSFASWSVPVISGTQAGAGGAEAWGVTSVSTSSFTYWTPSNLTNQMCTWIAFGV